MRHIILITALLTLPLFACNEATTASAEATDKKAELEIPEVSVADADARLKKGAVMVDANSERTRKKHGVVPNATILSSSSKYELAQLPSDKATDLIFYCSNTYCTASDSAAERAANSGYKNVKVMREGIKGWIEAGKPVQSYPSS